MFEHTPRESRRKLGKYAARKLGNDFLSSTKKDTRKLPDNTIIALSNDLFPSTND